MPAAPLTILPLSGLPMVAPGDDLAAILWQGIQENGVELADGDIIVIAQKIVSKAENCYVRLADLTPSPQALAIAEKTGKEPEFVECVLRESVDVVRTGPNVLIVEHRSGIVMANAGIDRSNIEHEAESDMALLLPKDADGSARRLRDALVAKAGATIAVVIADSVGRAWRYGTAAMAIGCAGIEPLHDQRGGVDMFGRVLEITEVALADQVAAAANLVMGEATEGIPAAIVRGLAYPRNDRPATVLLRKKEEDLFR